jgi:ADP-ribose pyrophosphatase
MEPAILSRKILLQLRPFDVERVHFRLPDGRERDYDLVQHVDAVTILPVDEQGQVHLVRQYRIGAEQEMLELPAGVMDPGEEAEVAARRELREEIGKDCGELLRLGGFFMAAGYSTEYMHVFLALNLKDAPLEQDDDEFLTTVVAPLSEVMKMAQDGRLADGKSLSTLLLARKELGLRNLL